MESTRSSAQILEEIRTLELELSKQHEVEKQDLYQRYLREQHEQMAKLERESRERKQSLEQHLSQRFERARLLEEKLWREYDKRRAEYVSSLPDLTGLKCRYCGGAYNWPAHYFDYGVRVDGWAQVRCSGCGRLVDMFFKERVSTQAVTAGQRG